MMSVWGNDSEIIGLDESGMQPVTSRFKAMFSPDKDFIRN